MNKKTIIGIIIAALIIATVLLYVFIIKNLGFSAGDKVYAEWSPKTWYAGTIEKTCDKGFYIKYDDGSEKCMAENELLSNKIPSSSQIKLNSKVIAKWLGTPYYDAVVTEINEEKYKVKYYDGVEYEVPLNELRLDTRN
jgi:hypothetical protein